MTTNQPSGDHMTEISRSLGKIEGTVSQVLELQTRTLNKLDEHAETITRLNEKVTRMEPKVDSHESLRQRSVGFIAALSALSGGAGAYLVKILTPGGN